MVAWSYGHIVGWLIEYNKSTSQHTNQPLFVGHNRPYDQPFPNRLFIELKRRECVIISRHWKFMFKRIFRVSECADACICTKRAKEKSTKLTKLASCVLGHPKCFRCPKTTYRYPTLQSRADLMLVYCKYAHLMHKFYAPNNHIMHQNFHSQIIKIAIYAAKKLLTKDAVSHIITKFAVYANKMCKQWKI